MRVFIDLFCGAGGLTKGFKRTGWPPLCGVDHDNNSAMSYLANHGDTTKCVVGSIEDDQIKDKLLESYGGRLTAVVGGPPCQ